jgi:hypothetical protein
MFKKIFSTFLLFALLVNYSISFWLTYELLTETEAANYLWAKWIIENNKSTPEKYRLWDSITRKETMKIMIKVAWIEVQDKCEWIFSDVANDWSCKYIEASLKVKFIAKADKFRPDDNITKTEALKMILKSKWIYKTIKTTNWQEDYMLTAFQYWLIPEKFSDYDSQAKRWWIFQVTTSTVKKEVQIKEIQSKSTNLYSDEVK